MPDHATFDVLIVGAGLAGVCLALECERRGLTWRAFSVAMPGRASIAASGLVNPMIPRKFNIVKNFESLLLCAADFYGAPTATANPLFGPVRFLHRLDTWQERETWDTKRRELAILNEPVQLAGSWWGPVSDAWVLDSARFIDSFHLRYAERIVTGHFDWSWIDGSTGRLRRNRMPTDLAGGLGQPSYIVSTEGWRIVSNPFWQDLRLKPARGDVIDLELSPAAWQEYMARASADFTRTEADGMLAVLHRQFHIIPLNIGRRMVRVGATLSWRNLESGPDEQARNELKAGAADLLGLSSEPGWATVVRHDWGVRPAMADRNHVARMHKDLPGLAVINGLGTRGILLAPAAARDLVEQLIRHSDAPATGR